MLIKSLHITLFSCILLAFANMSIAQNAMIDEFGLAPDSSAMLEINDSSIGFFTTRKGVIIPRMTQAEKNAIVQPANGLIVYQTDADSGFHYNRGTVVFPDWIKVIDQTQIVNPTIESTLIVGDNANNQSIFGIDTLGVDIAALPSNQFTVNESGGSTTDLQITDLASGTSNTDGLHLRFQSGVSELRSFENGPFIFGTNNLERMRLTASGLALDSNMVNNGLDVNGSASIDRLGINSAFTFPTTDGLATEIMITDGTGAVSWGVNTIADNFGNHIAIRNVFLDSNYVSNDGDFEGIFVDTAGNGGVGLTELETKFTVFDPSFPMVRVTSGSGGPTNNFEGAVLEFTENNPTAIGTDGYGFKIRYVGNGSNTDRLQFLSENNGTEELGLLLKRTSRRVGIGIEEPESWFHVVHTDDENDGVSIANINTTDRWHFHVADTNGLLLFFNNNLRGNFSSVSGAYFSLSDKRAKKRIRKSKSVIHKLMEIDVYQYQYLGQDENEEKSIGFLAQQLERQFPSMVLNSGDGVNAMKTVNYYGMNAVAIAAANEQYEELEELEKRLEKLEKRIQKKEK